MGRPQQAENHSQEQQLPAHQKGPPARGQKVYEKLPISTLSCLPTFRKPNSQSFLINSPDCLAAVKPSGLGLVE